ncbi:MAG: hypothetical protein ACPGYY_10410, partial [Bacteroidia bacterium]
MLGKRSAGNPHAAFEVAGAGNEFQDEQFLSMHKIAGRILESVEITRQLSTLLKYAAKTSEADMAKIARSYQAIGDAYE